jgi:hypothetical protein
MYKIFNVAFPSKHSSLLYFSGGTFDEKFTYRIRSYSFLGAGAYFSFSPQVTYRRYGANASGCYTLQALYLNNPDLQSFPVAAATFVLMNNSDS